MITGRQALNSIEEASAKIRADEMRLDVALRSASEEAARLRQERLKELWALAELKFGLIKSGELMHELDAAEQQAKDLLDRIRHEISEADARRQEAADVLQSADAIQRERVEAYDAAGRGASRARGGDRAKHNRRPVWIALKTRFEAASNIAGEAEKRRRKPRRTASKKRSPMSRTRC